MTSSADELGWQVEANDALFRRVARPDNEDLLLWDQGLQTWTVRSGAITFQSDGCSVYVKRVLAATGLQAADVCVAPQNAVAEIPVSAVESWPGAQVEADPDPETGQPRHPRDRAHALIKPPADASNKEVRRLRSHLAKHAAVILIDPN